MKVAKAMSAMAYLIAYDNVPDFDLKPDKQKPYGEIERSGKSRKSDRKRAPKWGRR